MMGLENGKCGNSFKGPLPELQTSETDVCVKQVIRNCKKNIISGPLYKYDKLSQHDFYVE